MASIRREISINASPEHVWSAVRDVGALENGRTRGVWIADLLPHELAPQLPG